MQRLKRTALLDSLVKHETLTREDISKVENLGLVMDETYLQVLLDELTQSGHLNILDGITPDTYTITEKGIDESKRLNSERWPGL